MRMRLKLEPLDARLTPAVTITDPSFLAGPVTTTADTYTIRGMATADSLVRVYPDLNTNGMIDPGESAVASQQLVGGATAFAVVTPLTPRTGNYFEVTETTASESAPVDVPIIVQANPMSVQFARLDNATTRGFFYSETVTATGGVGPYTFALTWALPPGLTLDPATGVISGRPTEADRFFFKVTATDATGRTADGFKTITVISVANTESLFAVGAGLGDGSRVRVFDRATGAAVGDFSAFEPGFTGGVSVAVGDVNNDNVADVVVAAGVGGGPRVIVVDGTKLDQVQADGTIAPAAVLLSFFAYEPEFHGGSSVALARVTGGSGLSIVTGAGPGGGPRVRAFGFAGDGPFPFFGVTGSFFAFDDSLRFGVSVAAGKLDAANPFDKLIVGMGVGGPPVAKVIDFSGAVPLTITATNLSPVGGAAVAAGFVDGTGVAQILIGGGPGGAPLVNVYDGAAGTLERTITAFDAAFPGGVDVTVGLIGGQASLVVGAGPGGGPRVRALSPDGQQELYSLFAFDPAFRGGVTVG